MNGAALGDPSVTDSEANAEEDELKAELQGVGGSPKDRIPVIRTS